MSPTDLEARPSPPARPGWRLCSPPRAAAIALFEFHGDLEAALAPLGLSPPPVGAAPLVRIPDIDHAILARPLPHLAILTPHGGPAIIAAIIDRLTTSNVPQLLDARSRFPEADSLLEAHLLDALSCAASPLAIDLLLAQPNRFLALHPDLPRHALPPGEHTPRDLLLRRLLDPPLVAALGPPNVGKSTLCNALAGRAVSIVADLPGTTRDHVGVTLDLAGLVVRYADTPGLNPNPDPLETLALRAAEPVLRQADLLLLCGDASAPPPTPPPGFQGSTLTLALRADRGRPAWPHDLALALLDPDEPTLRRLATLLRDTLLPASLLADPAPWRFWPPTHGNTPRDA
jgi:hypothetical protein